MEDSQDHPELIKYNMVVSSMPQILFHLRMIDIYVSCRKFTVDPIIVINSAQLCKFTSIFSQHLFTSGITNLS